MEGDTEEKVTMNGIGSSPPTGFRHHLPQIANLTRSSKIAQSKTSVKTDDSKQNAATLHVEGTGKVVKMDAELKNEIEVQDDISVKEEEQSASVEKLPLETEIQNDDSTAGKRANGKKTTPKDTEYNSDEKNNKDPGTESKSEGEKVFSSQTEDKQNTPQKQRRKSGPKVIGEYKNIFQVTPVEGKRQRKPKVITDEDDLVTTPRSLSKQEANKSTKPPTTSPPVVEKPTEWKLGDLLWAKVSGHPWWPCMVSPDPIESLFTKMKGRIRTYHVQFLGNEGERGWVTNIMEFKGKLKYIEHVKQLFESAKDRKMERQRLEKLYKSYPARENAMEIAIALAEEALPLSNEERTQNYTYTYEEDMLKSKKQTISSPKSKSLDNPGENSVLKCPPKRSPYGSNKNKRKRNSLSPEKVPKIKKRKTEDSTSNRVGRNDPSFEVFCQKHRDSVQEENPHFNEEKLIEYLKQQWNTLSQKQKTRYKSKFSRESDEKHSHRPRKPSLKIMEAEENIKVLDEVQGEKTKGNVDTSIQVDSGENLIQSEPENKMDLPEEVKEAGFTKDSESCVIEPSENKNTVQSNHESMETDSMDQIINDVIAGAGTVFERKIQVPKLKRQMSKDSSSSEPQEEVVQKVITEPGEYENEIFKLSNSGPSKRENLCQICEDVGDLLECNGPCLSFFHKMCVGLDKEPVAGTFKCEECKTGNHTCFACKKADKTTKKCGVVQCGKFYHDECVNRLINTRNDNAKGFFCPLHICQTCAYENPKGPKASKGRLLRCIRCPTAYHIGDFCIAAGSENLPGYNIVCSKHFQPLKTKNHHSHVNVAWCFVCNLGGSLLCCESCPAAFHCDCLKIDPPEGNWFCHDCSSGKEPLYGDIIWIKLGSYRWWPAEICHQRNVPLNIQDKPHQVGEFPVRFFGTHDFFWIHKGRIFAFQEGDRGSKERASSKYLAKMFSRGVEEACVAYKVWKDFKANKEQMMIEKSEKKPAPFKFIKNNIPIGNVQIYKADLTEIPRCECKPDQEAPCSSDTDCLNRMLMYECHPQVCPVGDKCNNQRFQKREYPESSAVKTEGRGWGLKTHVDIKKGQFVNEYVGELIDEAEVKKRIKQSHEDNISNFYMLTLDKNRIIDAGPKGNLSRFMNHSCDPNCETQKWTVNGDVRVGLFALHDIPKDSELTFNYNLECLGNDKTKCNCGAEICSGFLGVRPKTACAAIAEKKKQLEKKKKRRRKNKPLIKKEHEDDCFRCGEGGELVMCDRTGCPKVYHLHCLKLSKPPHGKWDCPWHHCDECGKQAVKMCVECPNSFCLTHWEGNLVNVEGQLYCSDHEDLMEGTSSSCASSIASSDIETDQGDDSLALKNKTLLQDNIDKKQNNGKMEKGSKKSRKSAEFSTKKGKSVEKGLKKGMSLTIAPMFDDSDEDHDLVIDIPSIP